MCYSNAAGKNEENKLVTKQRINSGNKNIESISNKIAQNYT